MSVHLGVEELADAAGGVLDASRTREVEAHVRRCAECQETWAALSSVADLLADEPSPTMPPAVAARLDAVLAGESRQRSSGSRDEDLRPPGLSGDRQLGAHGYAKPTLGDFVAEVPRPSRPRLLATALAACAAAGIVGFAGYFVSASAGLNEPTATAPAVVSSGRLGSQAHNLQESQDLNPHRFSAAWDCAREVTSGRITAITSAVVDGEPALLVYTRSGQVSQVTVVTGCTVGEPAAGPSTTLPR